MSTKISVIVPVYNVAEYITACLQSVCQQTYSEEIECILVDDCGTDDSIEIAKRFVSSYKGPVQFRIVQHEKNRGLSAARNTGIKEAQGEWLYFLDSDDSIVPTCLEDMFALTQKYLKAEMVQAGAICDYSNRQWLNLDNPKLPEYVEDPRWICRSYLQEKVLPMTAWNRLVNRNFIVEHSLYFEEGMINEDVLWTYRLARTVTHLAILRKNTYNYLLRNGSISSDSKQLFLNRMNILKKKVEYYENIAPEYHDIEFCSIASNIINYCYYDFLPYPHLISDCKSLLNRLAVSATIHQQIGVMIYCHVPSCIRQRIHFLDFIKRMMGINFDWQ